MRGRLRALLPRLHLLPALTVVVAFGSQDPAPLAERVAPDGDVLVVDWSVDELERLRAQSRAPNVFYLLGTPEVLPLPDASVDEVAGAPASQAAAAEFSRVLRT